ncbi:MAG: DUF4340 domain-containing protein [Myxococcota bacterium]
MNIEQMLRILMGAFLVQGLLAIITWWPTDSGPDEPRDLVAIDASELDRITVTGSVQRSETPDEPLVLARDGETWTLPSKFDLEVPETKIATLLETIDSLEVVRPIAENAYRHADLDVADDQHTRKLVLEAASGDTTTVFLGSASGSAAHVRVEGEDEVYRVRGITAYSIQTGASSYFDAQILDVDAATVDQLTVRREDGTAFTFTQSEGQWQVDVPGPAGRDALDPITTARFVDGLLSLRMADPNGTTTTPEMGLDGGTEVSWTSTEDGSTVSSRYVVGSEIGADSNRFYVKVDGKPFVYEVLGSQLENARMKPLTSLFVAE